MSTSVKIEVDEQTADVLHTRAAELGVTVAELVAELAALEADERTVPQELVVRWLRTWGTPRFQPWPRR